MNETLKEFLLLTFGTLAMVFCALGIIADDPTPYVFPVLTFAVITFYLFVKQ